MVQLTNKTSEKKISYFSAGPSKLPNEVLEEIQEGLLEYDDAHVSVLEMNHYSSHFEKIIKEGETLLRQILNIPGNYKVLFLQGGGTGQFAGVPLNLISKTGKADYIITGLWSSRAAKECEKYGTVNLVLPPTKKLSRIPPQEEWSLSPDASYVYYCDNETVDGLEFDFVPKVPSDIPLVCDMSSSICTRPVDVSKFGLIFAGAQKNIGCAGITVVIVREDLIGRALKICPTVLDYEIVNKTGSRRPTSPTFSIYVTSRVLSWVKRNGGVKIMEETSKEKSRILYTVIDQSDGFYCNLISHDCRSRMNVTFRIGCPKGDEHLENKFLGEAAQEGLLGLEGHRSVFGIRASLYNSITVQDAFRLAEFMNSFKAVNEKSPIKGRFSSLK